MRKCVVIINPNSGNGGGAKEIEKIEIGRASCRERV